MGEKPVEKGKWVIPKRKKTESDKEPSKKAKTNTNDHEGDGEVDDSVAQTQASSSVENGSDGSVPWTLMG